MATRKPSSPHRSVQPALTKEVYTALHPLSPTAQNTLFDSGSLSNAFLLLQDSSAGDARPTILQYLRNTLSQGETALRHDFLRGQDGWGIAKRRSDMLDTLISALFEHIVRDLYPLSTPLKGERLALLAVGGYGRGELAPFSDLDLLFLFPYKLTPRLEQIIESLLYYLWDIGFKVGHAARSLDETIRQAKGNITIATNLLEARPLAGDEDLHADLQARYETDYQEPRKVDFIEAKLAERDIRHRRYGEGSRYQLEPNIKESKGGLRDLHTLLWLARFLYGFKTIPELQEANLLTKSEARRFDAALRFLWTVRCHLHYLTGRAEERLTFDMQRDIAALMDYSDHAGTRAVERLMKRYFLIAKDVGGLTRIFCAQLEARHHRASRFRLSRLVKKKAEGFLLEGDRLLPPTADHFQKHPLDLLRVFSVAEKRDLEIHPDTLRLITQNLKRIDERLRKSEQANRIFLSILCGKKAPHIALRRMNEAGVLGQFIPVFGRIVSQMQFNTYHHYTVDEHTIRAIGVLHAIESGKLKEIAPIASNVIKQILSRRVLYLSVFLHDIAKGRGRDHSTKGAEIAREICPKLGLSEEETESVAWLVQNHLLMSKNAFARDLEDPLTIQKFTQKIQSLERLRLLLVLTVADIRAVGPTTWNAWKAALLRDLYWLGEEELSGGLITKGRTQKVHKIKDDLASALRARGWKESAIKAHVRRPYASYWLSTPNEQQVQHAQMIQQAEVKGDKLAVDFTLNTYREISELTVYTPDHPGLFSKIAGAIAVAGANVEEARIFTLSNGMALDIFFIRDFEGGPLKDPVRQKKLARLIEAALTGKISLESEIASRAPNLPSRLDAIEVAPRVLVDNSISRKHSVIEVNGRDRLGLLYDLTRIISQENLIIHAAKITTYGLRAVDVFYVHTPLGEKIISKQSQDALRKELLETL